MMRRGQRLRVTVGASTATYELMDGGGTLELMHHGERFTLTGATLVERPISPRSPRQAPSQPPGREPLRRLKPKGQ